MTGSLIDEAVALYGTRRVVLWCVDLLAGDPPPAEPPLVYAGGPHAESLLEARGTDLAGQAYWPRVWGARGLLCHWLPEAAPAVLAALSDDHWRVREMAAKVVRKRELGEAADRLALVTQDDIPRVRVAALRALALVGESEQVPSVLACSDDPSPAVRDAASDALDRLHHRLDRDF